MCLESSGVTNAANANAANANTKNANMAGHMDQFIYSRDQLLALRTTVGTHCDLRLELLPEVRRRTECGCRGGVKRNGKKTSGIVQQQSKNGTGRRLKLSLPSVVMGNVRSLENKVDELTALARYDGEIRECSLMCLTKTWLHERILNAAVDITGFTCAWADRTRAENGKRRVVALRSL